jgi:hypothetical protein
MATVWVTVADPRRSAFTKTVCKLLRIVEEMNRSRCLQPIVSHTALASVDPFAFARLASSCSITQLESDNPILHPNTWMTVCSPRSPSHSSRREETQSSSLQGRIHNRTHFAVELRPAVPQSSVRSGHRPLSSSLQSQVNSQQKRTCTTWTVTATSSLDRLGAVLVVALAAPARLFVVAPLNHLYRIWPNGDRLAGICCCAQPDSVHLPAEPILG